MPFPHPDGDMDKYWNVITFKVSGLETQIQANCMPREWGIELEDSVPLGFGCEVFVNKAVRAVSQTPN